jgi:hypothetical protein
MENYDLFQLKNLVTMKNIDYHQNEINDFVVDVEQEYRLNRVHSLQDVQELKMAKEEN